MGVTPDQIIALICLCISKPSNLSCITKGLLKLFRDTRYMAHIYGFNPAADENSYEENATYLRPPYADICFAMSDPHYYHLFRQISWNLTSQDLSGNATNASGVDFRKAHLSSTNLSEANLSRCNFSGNDLYDTNMRGCNLAEANLSGCVINIDMLEGANLVGANLWAVRLSRTTLGTTPVNALNSDDLAAIQVNAPNLDKLAAIIVRQHETSDNYHTWLAYMVFTVKTITNSILAKKVEDEIKKVIAYNRWELDTNDLNNIAYCTQSIILSYHIPCNLNELKEYITSLFDNSQLQL